MSAIPPPEALLIRKAREARGLSPEQAAEITPIRLGGGRWRQIERGLARKTPPLPVVAPARTLAHMARVVGVTSERLASVGRDDAAEILREIELQARPGQPSEAEPPPVYADLSNRHERALWELDLPEEERRLLIDILREGKHKRRNSA